MPIPKPKIFDDENHLIKQLKLKKTKKLVDSFFNKRYTNVAEMVRASIGNNTLRIFPRNTLYDNGPLLTFRKWATKYIQRSLNEIRDISTQDEYDIYVNKSTRRLQNYWKRETAMNLEVDFGRAAKIINLVLKCVPCLADKLDKVSIDDSGEIVKDKNLLQLEGVDDATRNRLIKLQHVPLDKFTIAGLTNVVMSEKYAAINNLKEKIKLHAILGDKSVTKNSSMGFIKDKKQYDKFQEVIWKICDAAGVPVIFYEILAWNAAHSEVVNSVAD